MKTLSAPWLIRLNWDELVTILVCLSLDIVEYILPVLMVPLAGDVIDLTGVVFCVFSFGWLGLISLFEVIPGFDVLPIFTVTWLVWYILKRRNSRIRIESELERWR